MQVDLAMQVAERDNKLSKERREKFADSQGKFANGYQRWYTEAHAVIRQLIPERLQEFEAYYRSDSRRKNISSENFTIQDWLTGLRAADDYLGKRRFDDLGAVTNKFGNQCQLLDASSARFESSLMEIRQVVQADLFDSELEVARELLASGFLRAAGAVTGVVIEAHLAEVADAHQVVVRKKHPTISDLNDALKAKSVLDVPTWRRVQRLGDLRNLCDHSREREPTREEVEELIGGTESVSKSVF